MNLGASYSELGSGDRNSGCSAGSGHTLLGVVKLIVCECSSPESR